VQELLDRNARGEIQPNEVNDLDVLKLEAEELNFFMEKSIVYLAERINLLEYDKRIMAINQSLGELIKGKYIIMDMKLKEEN
jgi:hypothetical protein